MAEPAMSGAVPTVPAPLRRFASFAPTRRAKLSASVLGPTLDTDEHFRKLVAFEVRQAHGELGDAVADGRPVPTADPVEVAALAYLLRPDGWEDLVSGAAQAVVEAVPAVDEGLVARLTDQLEQARTESRQTREKLRAQIAELKQENTVLRRKLNESRQRVAAGQERELASVRLRLLLDTVLDAAGGLRRELALPPPGTLRPADTVASLEP